MTIDEAIEHCLEVAEHNEALIKRGYAGGCNSHDCSERAEHHRQFAEWLTELKERRAADVKRGRWIYKGTVNGWDEMVCSSCDAAFATQDREQIYDWEFCPHCGADMRGDENA